KDLRDRVRRAKPKAIALSLPFAFANPENERAVAEALAQLGVPVSISHEILPEFREYERASTVLVNAYLAPKMGRYIRGLAEQLAAKFTGGRVEVMEASGGLMCAA